MFCYFNRRRYYHILERLIIMSQQLDDLTAQVATNNTVIGSALVLIQGFAAQLAAAGTDPAKLAQLKSDLASNDDALAAAVAANTPGVPPTPAAAKNPNTPELG